MISFKQLFEAFTGKFRSDVTKSTSYQFKVEGHITPELTIEFSAVQDDEENDVWDVSFKKKGAPAHEKFALTNDGQAIAVFGFVLDSIKELIDMRAPNIITFTAERDEGSEKRIRVYRKLMTRMSHAHYDVKELNAKNAVKFVMQLKE